MKRLFFFLLALFLIPFSDTEGQTLPFTHYTTEREINALPSAEVHEVFQDKRGFIWFSIYSSGLIRYDGVKMETYDLDDGLRDLTVWDLIEDPTGRLWVSSNSGLIVSEEPLSNYDSDKRIKFISESNSISIIDLSVNHNRMTIGPEGWLWVGTENIGIVKYRFNSNNELEADTLSNDLLGTGDDLAVRALTTRKDGSVWVSLLNGSLLKIVSDEVSAINNTANDDYTNALYESDDGTLWGGDKDGLIWQLQNTQRKPVFNRISSILNSNISNITSDREGRIWISSEGSGLLRIDTDKQNTITRITRSNGLLSDLIFNVLEDRESNIWIAQSGGISKLRYNYQAFTNITSKSPVPGEQPLLPSSSINTIQLSKGSSNPEPCSFWAGTSEGGIACISHDFKSNFIKFDDGLAGNWVNGLAHDTKGRLWIGSTRGLNSLTFNNTPAIKNFKNSNPIPVFGYKGKLYSYATSSILSIQTLNIPTIKGNREMLQSLWLPAYHKVYVIAGDSIFMLDDSWGLPPTVYHTSAIDSLGHVWIGTRDRGVYRSRSPFSVETLTSGTDIENRANFFEPWWSTDNGAPTNQIDNLLWAYGKMWIGTTKGLIALDAETKSMIHNINTSSGLLANNITSIALSPKTETFWIGTNIGLAEVNPETGKVLRTVTKADGLVDNEVWFYGSVQVDDDDTVYFGTANGISIYKPYLDKQNIHPPLVRLTKSTAIEVPGERNEFSFEYAALSFGSERQVRYQTRLLGFNDEWSDEKKDTRVNFTNLPAYFYPQTYTLEVRAVNESGVWSEEPLSYDFAVTPPWWLSWGASLGYLCILGFGIFTVDRFQRRRLINKEREAALLRETELKAETAIARSKTAEAQAKALETENELKAIELEKARELETAYHELKNTQKRLIQAEKMASLGRLSTGIAHEIKNPLNFINNFAELSKELVEELRTAIENNDTKEIELITKNLSLNTGKIEEHGKRADAIVKSMMQHSQSSNMKFELTDLNKIVRQHTELAYHSKSAKIPELEVSIVTLLDDELPHIMIMNRQMGQVLQNIIENALDAVWERKLKSNDSYLPEITITTALNDKEQIEIKIADNGPGIPEAVREKIFEPFFTTKPTGEGTGLGLSISYDVVTQIHNGSLRIESIEEVGSSFIIMLPVTQTLSS